MDESNATRVTAPPVEVAERGDRTAPTAYAIELRVAAPMSAKYFTGLLAELLKKRGIAVQFIRVFHDAPPLATYNPSKEPR